MTPHAATIALSVLLMSMSAWGYFGSDTPSMTALIPGGFGVALLMCYPGVKGENKIVAHIAALLVAVVIVALFMPLKGAIGRADTLAIVRVCVMILGALGTMVTYVRSFRQARAARSSDG